MKLNLLVGCVAVAALGLMSSCGDDGPPPKTGINFEVESISVLESFDGELESFHPELITGGTGRDVVVKILLDRPLSETTVIQYSVSGTASKTNPSGGEVNDFLIQDGLNTIVGSEKITIEKDATEATIIVTVFEDFSFEVDDDDNPIETAIIKLTSIVSGSAVLGEQTTYTLNIEEDDALIYLAWFVGDTESYGDVDMDMFVWFEPLTGDDILVNYSITDNADPEAPDPPYEGLFIPAGFDNGKYKMSYTYHSGTSDEVNFASIMWGRFNSEVYPYFSFETDDFLIFDGTYTLANVNPWSDEENGVFPPMTVQSMVKNGTGYSNISQISVPESGSRIGRLTEKIKFDSQAKGKLKSLKMVNLSEHFKSQLKLK